MKGVIQKAVALLRMEDHGGRLDLVLQDAKKKRYPIRLWEGRGVTQLPDPEWLLQNFIQRGGLTVVYGPPGSGKSLMMLDWAQRLQRGELWMDRHHAKATNVLYVMAEGQFGLKARLEAWQTHYEIEELPAVKYHIEGVSFWSPAGKENDGAEAIVSAAAALDVDVVFVDTMAATFGGGDENRQQDMNLYLRPLRELRQMGTSVVIAHHANRGEGAMRGSGVLGGDADTIVEMRPVVDKDEPGKVQWVKVVCQKQKDFVPFPAFRLDLISVPLEYERSGPLLIQPYDGQLDRYSRRTTPVSRQTQMAREIVAEAERNGSEGVSWRSIRGAVGGKNTELALVRDRLIEEGKLEYNEETGRYSVGDVPLETGAEVPPLLGYLEEE